MELQSNDIIKRLPSERLKSPQEEGSQDGGRKAAQEKLDCWKQGEKGCLFPKLYKT